jgi:hypothetical protein
MYWGLVRGYSDPFPHIAKSFLRTTFCLIDHAYAALECIQHMTYTNDEKHLSKTIGYLVRA